MSLTLRCTPLETHVIDGVEVHVKREDMCWPFPAISKARGVWHAIENRPDAKVLAVVDTGKSVNGLLVTTIGLTLGRKMVVGYPTYVKTPGVVPGPTLSIQSLSPSGDVELAPIQANRQFVMLSSMRQRMQKRYGDDGWFLFPTGLRLPETVRAVEEQMRSVTQTLGQVGTVVVPTGTGTHLAGVLRGHAGEVLAVQGYARPEARFRRDVHAMMDVKGEGRVSLDHSRLTVITSMCGYFEARPDKLPPWPANMHYEVKAYKFLLGVVRSLRQPVVFWNIGQ